ncbi:MAG TPA: DinB family protein [Bryobacteraceae bacterium]|nr:DinB family protein [Bryobacteraceae bacterium]
MVRIEQILDSWNAIRQDTISAVEEFPAGEMDYRPTPDVMTFGEIARHIQMAGDGLVGLLLAGEENFATPDIREKIARHAKAAGPDTASLAAALRESLERRSTQLARQPLEFFANLITRMDGQRITRLEMVQMLKEHELTHRAQLFLYLRMKGIVPATTRRRTAKAAGK